MTVSLPVDRGMFSIILPLLDPFDRFVAAGAVQHLVERTLALSGELELIVVNNNRTAASPRLTHYLRSLRKALPHKIKIVEPERNLGTARGFNAGLAVAIPDGAYRVFMSADADIVDPSMLRKIRTVMDGNPKLGIAHPVSVYEDLDSFNMSGKYGIKAFHRLMRDQGAESADIPAGEVNRIVRAVSGRRGITSPFPGTPLTFAVYRSEMLQKTGSFDEGVEYGCYETYDLGMRALLAGYDVARLDGIFINHRRLYIRNLVLKGTPALYESPHSDVIKQSYQWWMEKWGKPPVELYAQWRWGGFLFNLLRPYFHLRRWGGALKSAFGHH